MIAEEADLRQLMEQPSESQHRLHISICLFSVFSFLFFVSSVPVQSIYLLALYLMLPCSLKTLSTLHCHINMPYFPSYLNSSHLIFSMIIINTMFLSERPGQMLLNKATTEPGELRIWDRLSFFGQHRCVLKEIAKAHQSQNWIPVQISIFASPVQYWAI